MYWLKHTNYRCCLMFLYFVKKLICFAHFSFQLKCRLIKENGNPGEAVCKVAKERNVDHVVMGSRGLGTVSRALVGSVSDYCLHHANVPVSVVPPPDRFGHHGFTNKNWQRTVLYMLQCVTCTLAVSVVSKLNILHRCCQWLGVLWDAYEIFVFLKLQ